MTRLNHRREFAQAQAYHRLDTAFEQAGQKMLAVIKDMTTDMVFGFMIDAADLPRDKVEQVRAILRAFRNDREVCTRKAFEIKRRQIAVLLQNEPAPGVQRFKRWSSN
jgi:hypothetical protein